MYSNRKTLHLQMNESGVCVFCSVIREWLMCLLLSYSLLFVKSVCVYMREDKMCGWIHFTFCSNKLHVRIQQLLI